MKRRYYVGTYSLPILFGTGQVLEGKGVGIHTLELDMDKGELAAVCPPVPAPNPSYLALSPDKKFLYAVHELKDWEGQAGGAASAYAVTDDGLRLLSRHPTHGEDPCHISVSPDGRWAVAANFSGSCVTVFPIGQDGALQTPSQVLRHEGRGTHPQMQTKPHPHMTRFHNGRVVISDLGADRLFVYRLEDGRLEPDAPFFYEDEAGAGPRHFDFGNGLTYLLHELDGTVAVLDDALQCRQRCSILPPEATGEQDCADIHLTPDARFLFASIRRTGTLASLPLDPNGLPGAPRFFSCGGKIPRSFTIDPSGRFLLCVNQDSDSVTLFSLKEGNLTPLSSIHVPTPVCIIPS